MAAARLLPDYVFRPAVAADVPLLRAWRGRPHWVEWWGAVGSGDDEPFPEGVFACAETRAWIVELGGSPLAYAQDYDPHAWPGHHLGHLPPGARGIDQSIGPVEMLGGGHGSAFVRAHAARLFAEGAPAVGTDPHPANARAIRAYEKAGFQVTGVPLDTRWGAALVMEARPDARCPNPRSG